MFTFLKKITVSALPDGTKGIHLSQLTFFSEKLSQRAVSLCLVVRGLLKCTRPGLSSEADPKDVLKGSSDPGKLSHSRLLYMISGLCQTSVWFP